MVWSIKWPQTSIYLTSKRIGSKLLTIRHLNLDHLGIHTVCKFYMSCHCSHRTQILQQGPIRLHLAKSFPSAQQLRPTSKTFQRWGSACPRPDWGHLLQPTWRHQTMFQIRVTSTDLVRAMFRARAWLNLSFTTSLMRADLSWEKGKNLWLFGARLLLFVFSCWW